MVMFDGASERASSLKAGSPAHWLAERPIAHRGLHDGNVKRWENTISAFEAAIEGGYAIECDVQPTRDGEVVVFHDDTLERLTDREGSVRERTLAELQSIRVGGTKDRIPSLDEFLEFVSGRVPVLIELKGFGPRQDGFAEHVSEKIAAYGHRAASMSFDYALVARLTGEVVGLTAEGTDPETLARHEVAARDVHFVSYNVNHLPNPFVAAFRKQGGVVTTWTVRTPAQVETTRKHADQMTFEGFRP